MSAKGGGRLFYKEAFLKKRKKQKGRKPKSQVAASKRRALAEGWTRLAEARAQASTEEERAKLLEEVRSLARQDGGPRAFEDAVERSDAGKAEELLKLTETSAAVELAGALEALLGRPLPAGLAHGALEALTALGVEPGEELSQAVARAEEAAGTLRQILDETGDPEAVAEAALPLEEMDEALCVSALLEVFGSLSPDGWLGSSRLAGRSPSLDAALTRALEGTAPPGADALPLLKRLAASEVKETSKGARALIHKLKSRGVDVEEEPRSVVWSPPPPAESDSGGEALITGFDQSGHRMVWLALPAPSRGFDVAYAILSDSQGLISFDWGGMPKKKLAEVKEELAEEHAKRSIPLVEVDSQEACCRLEAGARLAQEAGRPVPEEYRAFERQHPPPEGEAPAGVYDVLPAEAVERARHSTSLSPSLLEDPQSAVAFWRLEAEAVAGAMKPAEDKRLIVSPTAPKVAEAEESQAVCDRLFSGELLEMLLVRLEEQALVFWLEGQPDRASLCLACAVPFRDDPLLKPSGHPFWRLWAEKLLQAHEAEAQRPEAEDRLILTPDEAVAEAKAARSRLSPQGRRRR